MYEFTDKWDNKTLTFEELEQEITAFALRNGYEYVDSEKLNHVAICIFDLYTYQTRQKSYVDDFVAALMSNDLTNAVTRADSINMRLIPLYVLFLYNWAPGDWREVRPLEVKDK